MKSSLNCIATAVMLGGTISGCEAQSIKTEAAPETAETAPSSQLDSLMNRISEMIGKILHLDINQILPDSVFSHIIDDLFEHFEEFKNLSSNEKTRVFINVVWLAVFDQHICDLFASDCYEVFRMTKYDGDLATYPEGFLKETVPPLKEVRRLITEKLKAFFDDPENLLRFWAGKRNIITEKLREKIDTKEKAEVLLEWLDDVKKSLDDAAHPAVQIVISEHDAAWQRILQIIDSSRKVVKQRVAAIETLVYDLSSRGYLLIYPSWKIPLTIPTRDEHKRSGLYEAFEVFDEAFEERMNVTPDPSFASFILPQIEKGGPALMEACKTIILEMEQTVKQISAAL